ncbi:MAG: 2OG-Fe(II) oxygenase family protein [Pseudomonadota bacterium]
MTALVSTEMFFPSLVWRFEVDPALREIVNSRLTGVLKKLDPNIETLAEGNIRQTDGQLHLVPDLKPMVAEFEQAIGDALEFMNVVYDQVQITGCWANVNAVGTNHREHVHPNNYLSGVYYVQADEGANQFTIDDPRPQRHMIRPRVTESTPFNASTFTLSVKPGDLLLFPAWLPHSVDYNRSNRVRISVSFNAMFEDFAETMSAPEWSGQLKTTSLVSGQD